MLKQSKILQLVFACAVILIATSAIAQTLYKYVDKDGKITYSDKPPKDGEKASKVTVDTNANITKLNTKDASGKEQKFADIKARGDARAATRDKLQADIVAAEKELEKAKKALEEGQEPRPSETRIVVGKTSNAIIRTEEYYARIAQLEGNVKKAEERVKITEEKFARGKPD